MPSILGIAAVGAGIIASSRTITPPAETVPGCFLVAFVGTTAHTDDVTTASTGWNKLMTRTDNNASIRVSAFFKKATGDDALVVSGLTATNRHWAYVCYAIDGADYIDGVDSVVPRLNSPTPAFAPVSGERGYLFLAMRGYYGDAVPTASPLGFSAATTALGLSTTVSINVASLSGAGVYDVAAAAWEVTGSSNAVSAMFAVYECPKIHGVVTGPDGLFDDYLVRAYTRDDGAFVPLSYGRTGGSALCNAGTGAYEIQCPSIEPHYVVAVAADDTHTSLIADWRLPS